MADTGTSIAQLVGQLKTSNANLPAAMSAVGGKEGGGESRSIVVNVNAAPATTQQDTKTEIVNQEKAINALDRIYGVLMQQLNFNRKEYQERQMELQVKPQDFQKQMVDSQKQVVTAIKETKQEDTSGIGGLIGAIAGFIPKIGSLVATMAEFAPAIATLVAAVAGFKALKWAGDKLGSTSISPGLGGFYPNAPTGTGGTSGEVNIPPRDTGVRTGPQLGEPGKPGSGRIKRWDDVDVGPYKNTESASGKMISSIMQAETGSSGALTDERRFIRTKVTAAQNKGRTSTAYGPVQMTKSYLETFKNRGDNYKSLPKEEQEYLDQLIEQGGAMMNRPNDPTYGYGKKGTAGQTERQRQLYAQIAQRSIVDLAHQSKSYSGFIKSFRGEDDRAYFNKIAKAAQSMGKTPEELFQEMKHMKVSDVPSLPEPGKEKSLVDKGIDKLKKWTGIEDNDEPSKNMVKTSELRVKGGLNGQAFKGGETEEGTTNLARVIQAKEKDLPGGLNRFSAFNDEYHGKANPKSKHTKGLALDFSLKDAKYSSEASNFVKQQLIGSGLSEEDFKIINEYKNPSKHSTGGHIHVNFANKEAAEKYSKFTKEGESSTYAKLEKQLPEGGRYGEEESEQEETNEPVIREPVSATKEATPSGGSIIDAAFAKLGAEADSEGMAGFGGLATILGGLTTKTKEEQQTATKQNSFLPTELNQLLPPQNFGSQTQQGNNPLGSLGNIFSTAGTMAGGISSVMSGIAGMKGGDTRSIINSVNGMLGMGRGTFGGMGGFGGNYPGRSGVDGSGIPNRREDGFGFGIPGLPGMGGIGNGASGTLGGLGRVLGGVGGMLGGFGMGSAGGMMGGLGRVLGGVGGMMGGGMLGGLGSVLGGVGGNYPGRSGVDGSGMPNRRGDVFGIPGMLGSMGNIGGMLGGLGVAGFGGTAGTIGQVGGLLGNIGGMMNGGGNLGGIGGLLGNTFGGPLGGLVGSAGGGALGGLFNSISSGGGIGDAVSGLLGGALGSTGGVGGILGSLGVTGFGGGFNPTVSKEGTGQYPGREGGNGGSLDEMMMKNLGIQREEGFPTMGGMGKDEYLKRQARGETFDPKTGAGSGGTSTPIQPRSMGDIGEGLSGLGKIGKDLGGAIFGGIGNLFGMGDGIASKGAGDDVASMKQQHGDSSGGMLESLGVSGIGSALGTSSLMSEGSSMMGGALDGLQSSFSSMMGSGSSSGGESASGGGSSTAIGNAGGGGGSGGGSPGFKSGDQRAGSSSGAMGIQMGVRNEESILQKAQYSVIRIV